MLTSFHVRVIISFTYLDAFAAFIGMITPNTHTHLLILHPYFKRVTSRAIRRISYATILSRVIILFETRTLQFPEEL